MLPFIPIGDLVDTANCLKYGRVYGAGMRYVYTDTDTIMGFVLDK